MRIDNPVLTGFNPDPSFIFADGFYYIAVSTFEYYPGVQIHRSADLVNWEVIARPVTKTKINMTANPESGGVWAPCLSYSDGLFYLIYTDVKVWAKGPFKDCSNYLITASDPAGEWSEPVYLNSSGFDASLFHEDNGKKYLLNMEWDYRFNGGDQFSGILIQEYDKDKKALTGEIHKIFRGTDRTFVEGPHIYKKDGYYYLFTAEGGTGREHAETVCRSKNLFGPYEVHPLKHIVTSYKTANPLQKAGHASICKNAKGEWFMAHLCGRPQVKNKCVLGRETSIQNIEWRIDGWPYIAGGGNEPRAYFEISDSPALKKRDKSGQIEFTPRTLSLDFQSLRIDIGGRVNIIDKNTIELAGAESIMSLHTQSALLYRQQHFGFSASAEIDYAPQSFMHTAGLLYRYNERNQYLLAKTYDENLGEVLRILSVVNGNFRLSEPVKASGKLSLKIDVSFESAQFSFSADGETYTKIGTVLDTSVLSDENADPMGFTGAFIGMYAGDFIRHEKTARFSKFTYNPTEVKS